MYYNINLLLFLIIVLIIYYIYTSYIETFQNINNKYTSENDSGRDQMPTYSSDGELGDTFNSILKQYNFIKVEKDGEWFFPSDYNPCERQAKQLIESNSKYIYVMDGCDIIGSKIDLWKVLRSHFGLVLAEIYMPMTYLYENEDDMIRLKNKLYNSDKHHMFILKNYNQRQEGLKIVSTWDEINDVSNKKKYYLIQEYLYDPFIISKRKINIRIYYLVVCRYGHVEGYIYYNGFMYYTPEYYDPESLDFNKHITTGYIDRQVYVENPLTFEDLRKYLGIEKTAILDKNINKAMHNITEALTEHVCTNKNNNKIKFQVYGVDIAPLSNLSVKLMEINKGPDLNAKDERDGFVKKNMQADIFKVIDPLITTDKSNGFIRIY